MVREMESENQNYLLNTSQEDYCKYLVKKYSENIPILLKNESYTLEAQEVRKNGSEKPTLNTASMLTDMVIVTIVVPFEGNPALFLTKPSEYAGLPPSGKIIDQELHLPYSVKSKDSPDINEKHLQRLENVEKYLDWIKKDVKKHNKWIKQNVKRLVIERREKILKNQGLVESIGLPIKRTTDVPEVLKLSLNRKKAPITKPSTTIKQYKPEPELEEAEYKYILNTLTHMTYAMERSPSTFNRLSEEEIRDFFLIILNSHYEGQAIGETFNSTGKTDILIRADDKNVFIAECKIWDGPKTLTEAIDQILKYTTWRDTKTAILLFNKDRTPSTITSKIDRIVKSHDSYKRNNKLTEKLDNESVFSYVFHQLNDINRELIITVMVFDIPK